MSPLCVHHEDDEAWYVLDGELRFRLGDEEAIAGPGSAVLARRGRPHTYWNAGAQEARYLLVMKPKISSSSRRSIRRALTCRRNSRPTTRNFWDGNKAGTAVGAVAVGRETLMAVANYPRAVLAVRRAGMQFQLLG